MKHQDKPFKTDSPKEPSPKAIHEFTSSKEHLRLTQEMAHLGSWELDLINNILYWSDEVYRIFGLEPQEFKATYEAFLESVDPDDRTAVDSAYSQSIKEVRDGYEIEHRIVRKSTGEVRYVHEKCKHIKDDNGKIILSIGMVHDITERKKIEQEIKDSQIRMQIALDSGNIGIYEWDIVTHSFKWDEKVYSFWGLSPSIPANFDILFKGLHPDEQGKNSN